MFWNDWAAQSLRRALLGIALAVGVAGGASAATYLGSALTEVKPADRVSIANPHPVQLLFQFQTKGAPNARATKLVQQQVTDAVKAAGLFSDVSTTATSNGAILSLSINDVASPKDMRSAEAKGFATGATFFIAGSNVYDHYICTAEYVASPTAAKISKTAEQTLIFQLGLINSAPADAVKVGSLKEGIALMIRQLVGNSLNDVGKDPGFQVADASVTSNAASGQTAAPPAAAPPTSTSSGEPAAAAAPATAPAAASQPGVPATPKP
jgi:hypothetical protein